MDKLFTWLASLFQKNHAAVDELKNPKFYSKRVWMLVAAIVGAIFFPSYFTALGWQLTVIIVAFILGDSYTAGKTIDANARLRQDKQSFLAAKGVLGMPVNKTPPTA